jgi:protein-S-isoprenylcysteine O-methyltransferase Ste14
MTTASRCSPLELRVPPLVVVLIVAAANWLAARAAPQLSIRLPAQQVLAAALVLAGVLAITGGVLAFRRARTTVDPVHADRASSLVATGIYRITRNPMYLGMLLALSGWALYLGHAAGLLLLPAFVLYMNRYQIAPEERVLAAKFGESFAAYRRSVRRWV